MSRPMLVFDMDGVLVEVKESYRESIRATVQHFTGREPSHALIQDYKNRGGWNNDWKLSQELCRIEGHHIAYDTVIEVFNQYFFGHDGVPGLILRERWIDSNGVLSRLNDRFDFAVFTGRLQQEARITLARFATHLRFAEVIGDDDVSRSKPDPEGLLTLQSRHNVVYYLGDTVDDARAAAAARVPFIAITAPGGDFSGLAPAHFLTSINELETIL
ncbi:MAG: HAD-IA family hydrolase [Bryobacter sp.]|jgi:HAD superfamily phosphatase|nr:HAD-IA family hydrolase [Bryobacter sp. CoA8 C33]